MIRLSLRFWLLFQNLQNYKNSVFDAYSKYKKKVDKNILMSLSTFYTLGYLTKSLNKII